MNKFETCSLPSVEERSVNGVCRGPCVAKGNLSYFVSWKEENKADREKIVDSICRNVEEAKESAIRIIVCHMIQQTHEFLISKGGFVIAMMLPSVLKKQPENKALISNILHFISNGINEDFFYKDIGFISEEGMNEDQEKGTSEDEREESSEDIQEDEDDATQADVMKALTQRKMGRNSKHAAKPVPLKAREGPKNLVRDETSTGDYPRNEKRKGKPKMFR